MALLRVAFFQHAPKVHDDIERQEVRAKEKDNQIAEVRIPYDVMEDNIGRNGSTLAAVASVAGTCNAGASTFFSGSGAAAGGATVGAAYGVTAQIEGTMTSGMSGLRGAHVQFDHTLAAAPLPLRAFDPPCPPWCSEGVGRKGVPPPSLRSGSPWPAARVAEGL